MTHWLEQIITLKSWIFVCSLVGTALVSMIATYGVIQIQQSQRPPITVACPPPVHCQPCVQHPPQAHKDPYSKLLDFKLLPRTGKKY